MIWKSMFEVAALLVASCSGGADTQAEVSGFVAVGHDAAPDGCTGN